ncbi:glycogen synthase GlgA [Tepidibacter hydrothermalis]|uniref:Glycogen synthase n=1 Tax=Tepidibacter hydrothermalis TaxID=3036126 RepID=A0ABY8EKZ3_9FIRM|nr:glycogen synthase GlgA [Tepidibacter hydrothermalis]WFD11878.1 glycogen synthase GlgA [Tepidibacter hydrothermalis]
MLKVLYVASEAVPFVKVGGLADVAFSLPKSLRNLGIDIRVIIPKYKEILEKFKSNMKCITEFTIPVGLKKQDCRIEYLEYEGVPFYFIDQQYYFEREGIYGFDDDDERFSYLCKAVLGAIENMDFKPNIIHCNDWHSGMICPLLKEYQKNNPRFSNIKTVFTIHNLKYQGIYSKKILESLLNLGMKYYDDDALKHYKGVSFMKAGINYADLVTTVSKTYSEEIQRSSYGEGLDDAIRKRKNDLYGIINGVDYNIYDPSKDDDIFVKYNVNCLQNKMENKVNLQKLLNLPVNKKAPLIAIVSRLTYTKGIELLIPILENLLSKDIQMVILGMGDPKIESKIKDFAYKYPEKLSANILFNEVLAHKIYAASDIFLMPSLREPCGLSQLIALKYGSIPIVRKTGGLKDTINSYNKSTGEGNGFRFTDCNGDNILNIIDRALKCYKDKRTWKKITINAMKANYSWENSTKEYKKLYESLVMS